VLGLAEGCAVRFSLVVRQLVDPATPGPDLERALAQSTPAEQATAIRLLRLRRGAAVAELDQVVQEQRELERRYPGIGDEDEEPPAA
jgi:hypothetical protein